MNVWIPIVLGAFKLIVLAVAVFFAIKSHRDGERREKEEEMERERIKNESSPLDLPQELKP